MSLLDDAQEAWDNLPEGQVPEELLATFIAGYLAACKDLSEQLEERTPTYYEPFREKEVPRDYVSGKSKVWIDDAKLQELNVLAGKDPQDHL